MADWTQLPKELLDLISKRLDTPFDVFRFRSVCSTWRSTVTSPRRHRLAPRFPVLPDDGGLVDPSFGFSLSKRTVFLIGSPKTNSQTDPSTSWVIKIEEDVPNRRIQLLNPLSRPRFDSLPDNFPKRLNLLDFRVFELGEEYVLHYLNHPNYLAEENLYMEKVVLSCLDNNNVNDFVLLTIHVSGKLAMFKSSDKKWTIIQDMPSPYDDVILHEGKFLAVDNTGRAVLVGLDSELSVVAMAIFGGDKKFLVESKGELLLVDMYLSIEADEGSCSWAGLGFVEEYFENLAFYMNERTVKFKVFKLDRVGKQWVEAKNLDDRVLFLGDDCTFSASAEDLSVCRGNCIIFADNYFYSHEAEDGTSERCDVGVFDLENGSIGPLWKFPQFSKLFWPPPRWISSTTLDAQINTGESA
ncbi:hypothetical protein PTKIN_Ptkin02bG0219000 [Pterospermum kingtungense]